MPQGPLPTAFLAPLASLPALAAWGVGVIALLVAALMSAVIVYHWFRYGLSALPMWIGIAVYGAGGLYLALLILAGLPALFP